MEKEQDKAKAKTKKASQPPAKRTREDKRKRSNCDPERAKCRNIREVPKKSHRPIKKQRISIEERATRHKDGKTERVKSEIVKKREFAQGPEVQPAAKKRKLSLEDTELSLQETWWTLDQTL